MRKLRLRSEAPCSKLPATQQKGQVFTQEVWKSDPQRSVPLNTEVEDIPRP